MTRRLATIVILMSLTGCATHRTCTSQDMIAMKESGFSPGQIENSCTTSRFDAGAFQTIAKGVADGMDAWAELEKSKREAGKQYGSWK